MDDHSTRDIWTPDQASFPATGQTGLSPDLIRRYASVAVPRYTSYPTAPHFHGGVTGDTYRAWLAALPPGARLSLYVHIPFCDTLCWFCGCHTKITRKYEPVAAYIAALVAEAKAIAAALPAGVEVDRIHWGGGSPTILRPDDITRLATELAAALPYAAAPEFAIEVDPRGLTPDQVNALASGGLTRVSIGVQDFDPQVQKAINRIQSFDETKSVIDMFRAAGIASINIDAIYGLPGQQDAQLTHTLQRILELKPDRISLFGYAHVPWMKKHQSMIVEADLPDSLARHAHAELAAAMFEAGGYRRIGLDHFALPDDPLSIAHRDGVLTRNFQGYSADPADAIIGLGASSIGRLPQGYVQNTAPIAAYMRQALSDGIATARGYELNPEDRVRAKIIERLMCDFTFDPDDLPRADRALSDSLTACARDIVHDHDDHLVAPRGAGFAMTDQGRPFVRLIAARFDAHLAATQARHSAAV
jgi:oxygen-independent coproporphyrinogen-3 oxidase